MQEQRYKQNIREKIAEINLELGVSREKCEFLISKGVILGDRENRERYDSIMAHCENLIKAKAYLEVFNEIEDLSNKDEIYKKLKKNVEDELEYVRGSLLNLFIG